MSSGYCLSVTDTAVPYRPVSARAAVVVVVVVLEVVVVVHAATSVGRSSDGLASCSATFGYTQERGPTVAPIVHMLLLKSLM